MRHLIVILCMIFCIPCSAKDITYNINDLFSISVSDLLELRKDSDAYTRFLKDTLHYKGVASLVFQQNKLSVKDKNALKRYCRILIMTDNNGHGEYPPCNDSAFSSPDLDELISLADQELALGQSYAINPSASIEKNDRGISYIRVHYIRTGPEGDVCVNMCFFFNYNSAAKIIFSYRQSEAAIWKEAVENAINSIEWFTPFRTENIEVGYEIPETATANDNKTDLLVGIIIGVVCTLLVVVLIALVKSHNKKTAHDKVVATIINIEQESNEKHIVKAQKLIEKAKKVIPPTDNELRAKLAACQESLDEKVKLTQKQIYDSILEDKKASSKADIEKAETVLKRVQVGIDISEMPERTRSALKQQAERQEKEYTEGVVADTTLSYVAYDEPISIQETSNNYTKVIFPKRGNVVFPYRRRKVALRGYTEGLFQQKLTKALCGFTGYKVIGDASILPHGGYHPYEPDIAIVEQSPSRGIRIDIEIDEPYSGYDKSPIHYIGCGDEFRDANMVNLGWIVIRFSEKQIFLESAACVAFVKHVISLLDSTIEELPCVYPSNDKRWTFVEAQLMAARQYRERMLNHQFGRLETDELNKGDITLTNIEQEAASKVPLLSFCSDKQANIDNSCDTFSQDSQLAFIPEEHVYVFRGTVEFRSVSSVVSSFFSPFDTQRWSEHVARKEGRNRLEVIEEWDAKGTESREIGTFLHAQIEAYLMHRTVENSTIFRYNGEFVNIDKEVSIEREIQYFKQFMAENVIQPFRAEWHICDESYKIAGTIDLLCKNGQKYDIYDWKRSRKALPNQDVWQYGINGLEGIPDIKFYHYALQQNLYKYILERNYGITIGSMYLVVLHPIYSNYQKIKVPEMASELNIILKSLN